jgi:hypothetical protein
VAITERSTTRARRGTYAPTQRLVPAIAAVATALILGLALTRLGYLWAMMLFAGIGVFAVAMVSPYWAMVLGIAQFAFIPSEGSFFSISTPNQLQIIGPLLVVAALLRSLKEFAHDRLAPRLTDYTVAGFGLWGLMGLLLQVGAVKWYVNRMILPMSFYYVARLVRLTRERIVKLAGVALGAVSLQSLMMIRESSAGSSPIYAVRSGLVEGVKAAKGPFPYHWTAGAFLAMWPALFVYMIANSKSTRARVLWAVGLLVVLIANTRTMQRAGTLASLIAIACCLIPSQLRRTASIVIVILAIAYVPWSMGKAGGALMDRFDQTDESRVAYRIAAINLLKSDDWNPVYGVGWSRGARYGGTHGTDDEVLAWGSRRITVAEIAEGAQIHNVWLALPVEFGIGGVLLALAVLMGALASTVRVFRRARERPVDTGLLVALWGGMVALGAIAFFQNTWHYPVSMSVMWLFYGLIVSKPDLFDIDEAEGSS